ncbi:FKBP-type peptidyl-prolyl cis-trans isomerase FklB [Marinicellulosiphila megalodicopiae]
MLATSVSFVACSSSDDEKDAKPVEAVETSHADMSAKAHSEMSEKSDAMSEEMATEEDMKKESSQSEKHLSYYIGFNVSSSIKASDSFTLVLDQAITGLLDGANGVESSVSAEQLQAADALLRAQFEEKQAAAEAETEEKEVMAPSEELKMAEQHLSYYIGFNISSSIIASKSFELDTDSSIEGLTDGANGVESKVTPEQLEAADAELRAQFEAKQAELNKEQMAQQQEAQKAAMAQAEAAKVDGLAFLEANKAKEGVMTTDSGLQYSVITKGDASSAMPSPADSVKVHYHGTLTNGTVFDSSVNRGEPISFPLNGVISGWTEGLQLMQVGDTFRFFIPSELAYGARSTGMIPANSVLIFDVELLGINAE